MILESHKINEVLNTGESKRMQIDTDSISILQMLLSQGLYSDPKTAVIAELSNNGIDSVIESGKDPIENPVIVSIGRSPNADTYELSVKDCGLGLNEEDFDNILGYYLKSTKRSGEHAGKTLGAFGIGSRSPLSVADSYYWICIKDGVKRKFIVFKGEEFTEYEKVFEEETDEENGVEVVVPIADWYEKNQFVEKAKQKLAYYDTVVLIVDGNIVNNKIFRHELFQYSTLCQDSKLHFCLKDVYYSIDFSKLGISDIYLPVALRFGLNEGLLPNPSRESIIYSKEVITLFLEKIKKVANYFVEKYNESVSEKDSFVDVYESLDENHQISVTIEDIVFSMASIAECSDISLKEPTIKGVSLLDLKRVRKKSSHFMDFYVTKAEIANNRYSTKYNYNIDNCINNILKSGSKKTILASGDDISKVQLDYIKDTVGDCYIIRKSIYSRKLKVKGSHDTYFNLLGLHQHPKENWRQLIKEWQLIENDIISRFTKIEDIVPTQDWLEERKRRKKRAAVFTIDKEEINPKYGVEMEVYRSDALCKFVSDSPTAISTFRGDNKLYIYGTQDNRKHLECLWEVFKRQGNDFKVVILVERDITRIKQAQLDNWYSIEEYMKGEHDSFGKFCTASLIQEMIKGNEIFKHVSYIKDVDGRLGKRMEGLNKYVDNILGSSRVSNGVLTDMLKICEEKSLWDTKTYKRYLSMKQDLPNIEFIKHLKMNRYQSDFEKETLPLAKEIYNYKRKLNNEQTTRIEVKSEQPELDCVTA